MRPRFEEIIKWLNEEKQYPIAELAFITEGLDAVIKARKILSWTYAYGYFMDDPKTKHLFEDL